MVQPRQQPLSPAFRKVLVADNAAYAHQLAENVSLLIAEVGAGYDNIIAPATADAKNTMPRVAAFAGCRANFRDHFCRIS